MKTLADKIKAAKPGDVVIHSSEYTQSPEPWWTSQTGLWLVRGDERTWCNHVSVRAVGFRMPVLAWRCGGCGESMIDKDMFCCECGEPRSHAQSTTSDGEFTIKAVLPYNGFLWDLIEDDQLVVRHVECGRRDVWANGETVVALTVDGHGHDCMMADLVLPEQDDHVRIEFTPTGTVEAFRKWQK